MLPLRLHQIADERAAVRESDFVGAVKKFPLLNDCPCSTRFHFPPFARIGSTFCGAAAFCASSSRRMRRNVAATSVLLAGTYLKSRSVMRFILIP